MFRLKLSSNCNNTVNFGDIDITGQTGCFYYKLYTWRIRRMKKGFRNKGDRVKERNNTVKVEYDGEVHSGEKEE